MTMLLKEYDFDENVVASGFLHDVVEDTDITLDYLKQFFTEDICLVWLDDSKGLRRQRYDEEKRSYNFQEKEDFERRELDEFVKTIYNNNKFHVLYFTNEDIARVSSIVYACVKHNELVYNFEKTFK